MSREKRLVKKLIKQERRPEFKTPIATDIFIPNHSGDHSRGKVFSTPVDDYDICNKAYADSVGSGAPEGTDVKSTGEAGATKFLREDGDGTSSWQTVPGSGAPEGTEVLSTGEAGGTKFLREDGDGTCSWQTPSGSGDALTTDPLSQFAATTSTQLRGVMSDETGTGNLVFATSPTLVGPALGTPASGVLTNCTGTASGLTAGNVTTNANLTGDVTSTGNATSIAAGVIVDADINAAAAIALSKTALVAGTNITLSTNTLNVDDAFIKNDADDTSTGKITAANFAVTGDNNTNDTEYVPMVLHGTDATPPTASTVPRGSIYIQYTA